MKIHIDFTDTLNLVREIRREHRERRDMRAKLAEMETERQDQIRRADATMRDARRRDVQASVANLVMFLFTHFNRPPCNCEETHEDKAQ